MNKLAVRALSGFIFVAIMIGASTFQIGYILLISLIVAFSTNEYLEITTPLRDEKKPFSNIYRILLIATNVLAFLITATSVSNLLSIKFISIIPVLLFCLFIVELYTKSEKPITNIALNLSAFIYIGVPFSMLNFIVYSDGLYQPSTLLGILILVWIYDSAAYLIGSTFGSRKLFERISPNKTWEGSIGGLLVLTAIGFGFGYIPWFSSLSSMEWAVISWLIAYFSATGDLVQSLMKRSLKIKDSGNILPGHGGFLDRFDAFIFVIPFIAFYILCFT
ncbi:MAG: phosphatidate cytidylyltransferase [Chitinophagales bacterium]|nr:phosphatidate cytidylyltransferase [Bacteroidota bacterium]MCB9225656.1 phosphatidate cytidylyltransferase [Chitinophagales bacterium]